MTLGLVIGKFYPPHRGHKHLIDTARSQCDRLIVVLPHHPSQNIPGELRRDWLQEIHPDCEIHLVPDDLENDSQQWADWTIAYLGRSPDVVFTSEDYGPDYARCMNCRHVMVDRTREIVPISGTAIRSNPLEHLDYLEPCVRAYFIPRVVLIGAESTGKTTLAQHLANVYQTNWVAEYGREYWEQKAANWQNQTPIWRSDEFVHIAAEQQRRENLAARTANKILFCDTNAFATGTWHERYVGHRNAVVDAIGQRDVADLYLLLDVDVPFTQDGWRDGESIRDWMHGRFVEQLSKQRKATKILSGSWPERTEKAGKSVAEFLSQFHRLRA